MLSAEHKRKLIEQTRLERSKRSKNLEYGSGDSPRCRGEETALKKSGEQFKAVFDNTLVGLYRTTPDGRILMANPALVNMLGYSSFDELAGRNLEREGYEPHYPRLAFKERIESEGNIIGLESAWKKSDDTTLYVRESAHAVRDELGKTLYYQGTVEDITERKRTEEALREAHEQLEERIRERTAELQQSKERFRLAAESTSDLIYEWDISTGRMDWFGDVDGALGFEFEEFPRTLEAWAERIHPKDQLRLRDSVGQHRESTESISEEYQIQRKDGTWRHWTHYGVLVLDNEGRPQKWIGACNDTTDRKHAEEAIRESEEKFRTLADQSPNMIYINKKGTIVYANRKCEEIMGYTEAEVSSPDFDFMTLIAPESADRIRQNYARHLRGEEVPQYEYTALTKGGERIELINSTKLIQYEGEMAVLGIVTDITERKRAVEALQQSENKFRTIFETAANLITSINNDGIIIDCNSRVKEVLGYEKEEIIGQPLAKIIHPDYVDKANKGLQDILAKEYSQNKEYKMVRKNGTLMDVSINCSTLTDERGKPVSTICIIDDITERKQARQRLIEDREQLKSLASKLSLTEERERQRLATELHDQVGQSLVISKAKLDQLHQSTSPGETADVLEEVRSYLEQIIRDTRTLTFDLSYPILYELGIEAAIDEWLTEEIREKHGIETEFEHDNEPKPLADDIKAILFRNVRELLINVVKYADATNVKVSIHRFGEQIRIVVTDDGVGFDPAEVQATAARNSAFGLFSIRERLEQLGGFIEIDAEPGRGSRISMTAPLKQTGMDNVLQANR